MKSLKIATVISKIFAFTTMLVVLFIFAGLVYLLGVSEGINSTIDNSTNPRTIIQQILVPATPQTAIQTKPKITWGGPELWDLVNKRRKEYGVPMLSVKAEVCTITSIRLNELLEKQNLDGHEGFSTLPERRPDLKPIFEEYNLTEFLLMGAQTADEAVKMWENTLAHKKLLTAGEYVWGCIYAQDSFAVAITAY